MLDALTRELLEELFTENRDEKNIPDDLKKEIAELLKKSEENSLITPIVELFSRLMEVRNSYGVSPERFQITKKQLEQLAEKHQSTDEHGVSVGGRAGKALQIVEDANARVENYIAKKAYKAPSGLEIWDEISENVERIKSVLGMTDEDWNSYKGQLKFCINDVDTLAKVIDLPADTIRDVARVTESYRMRLTPYYASLIRKGDVRDPVLLQSVPMGEMLDNIGVEIPPVASDHSPARLVDQFYPRVVTIKATNMCAMYCTHCLRIAHIGKKDMLYDREAYNEALDYIRKNERIRDVLITGGDAFVLPNDMIEWLLDELCKIEHVGMIRMGTRIPVTAPQRVDDELLSILAKTNKKLPLRVVVQINTAQEITPVSKETFKKISANVSAVLNQAVLLKGINDSRTKMWKLCETIQESYVRPYYLFNCSYRNPQFAHFRVPTRVGIDIIESMYGNISGDAIPRYVCPIGGKIPMHRSNVKSFEDSHAVLTRPWDGEEAHYPDVMQDVREQALDYIDNHEKDMLKLLEELVCIQSSSHSKKGVDRVVEHIKGSLESNHVSFEVTENENCGNFLEVLSGHPDPTEKHILLVGHMDTVFPEDTDFNWYKEDDLHSHGPGVIDMKGGLVAAIYAFKALDSVGLLESIPVRIAMNSDEETGSRNSKTFIKQASENALFAVVMECGGANGGIVTGRKGNFCFKIDVEGRAGHAAFADASKASATLELAYKITKLEALNDYDRGITINVGTIEGGIGHNTVAPTATAVIDCRYETASDYEHIIREIEKIVHNNTIEGTSSSFEIRSCRPPMEQKSSNRKLYNLFAGEAEKLGIEVYEEYRRGVSDANDICSYGIPVIDGIGPIGAKDHSKEEYMIKSTFHERAKLLVSAIIKAWQDSNTNCSC